MTVIKSKKRSAKLPLFFILSGIGIAIFAFSFLFPSIIIKNSDAYEVAIKEIEHNQKILTETGGIKEFGMMPSGNVLVTNGIGQAQLEIKVIGNKKNLNVDVYLTKELNGGWELIELNQ